MSFYSGFTCPVCNKMFSDNDDVVGCPHCGAPHHRHCWSENGQCFYDEKHGTNEQWRAENANKNSSQDNTDSGFESAKEFEPNATKNAQQNETVTKNICPSCQKENYTYSEFCSNCGHHLSEQNWTSQNKQHGTDSTIGNSSGSSFGWQTSEDEKRYNEYSPFITPLFDPYGGVKKDDIIGECTAEELVTYTGNNSSYYLTKFKSLKNKKSAISWNWAAFFFPSFWLMYRKNYLVGIGVTIFELCRNILFIFLSVSLSTYFPTNMQTSTMITPEQLERFLLEQPAMQNLMYLLSIFFLISFVLGFVFGIFGNRIYLWKCTESILKARTNFDANSISPMSDEYRLHLSQKGGASMSPVALIIALSLLSVYVVQFMISSLP